MIIPITRDLSKLIGSFFRQPIRGVVKLDQANRPGKSLDYYLNILCVFLNILCVYLSADVDHE